MTGLTFTLETVARWSLGPQDFVDWDKIDKEASELRREIALLQSLRHAREPAKDLAEFLVERPEVLRVIEVLVAHAPDEIRLADGRRIQFKGDVRILSSAEGFARASEIAGILVDIKFPQFLKTMESVRDCVRYALAGLESAFAGKLRGRKPDYVFKRLVVNAASDIEPLSKSHTQTSSRQEKIRCKTTRRSLPAARNRGEKTLVH